MRIGVLGKKEAEGGKAEKEGKVPVCTSIFMTYAATGETVSPKMPTSF